ncbi:LysR family transcriptional regulator [Bordetella parapertussis]|uniref:LysR-family transcriptional regulator n=1 Tax=Bordetella parapertussis (strain Bpp5) TaxID=1208660 RepID=K0MIE3_BORPB|nr:LysR-family transcriptional regulator [Bordetella parapertussis Bpp5]
MELRHLRYFLMLAETLHFGRAASRLGIAQPPLSRQIRDLEEQVGATLFYRGTRGVSLTDAGVAFAQRAAQIVAAADEAVFEAREAGQGRTGRIVIGFVHSLAYSLLPRVLPGFRQKHPGIAVSLREVTVADKESALLSGQIDTGIYRPTVRHPEIATLPIFEEGFVLALPSGHPLARKRRVSVHSLRDQPLILFRALRGDVGLHGTIAAFLRAHDVPVKACEEVSTIHAGMGLVLAGVGVCIIPETSRMVHIEGVVTRPFAEATTRVSSTVCWRHQDSSRSLDAWVRHVRELIRTGESAG